MGFKDRLFKLFAAISSVFLAAMFFLIIFWFATDCPETAGYVYCRNNLIAVPFEWAADLFTNDF